MNFQSIPENYAPVSSPILYAVEFAQMREVVDVKIVDLRHDELLGVKRLYDVTEAQIDIAPYLKRAFDFRPAECGTGVIDADGLYAVVALEIDGQRTPERCFAPYDITDGYGTIFRTGGKHRLLSRSDSECVVIYAPNGGLVRVECYSNDTLADSRELTLVAQQGLQMLKILPDDLAREGESLIIAIEIDGLADFLIYQIIPTRERARRVMWIDAEGELRYYTFPTCLESRCRVKRQVVSSEEGEVLTSCEKEHTLTLVSDYETTEDIERIGGILGARKVWLDHGVTAERVEVVSTEMVLKYGGALNSLQVELRLPTRKEVE